MPKSPLPFCEPHTCQHSPESLNIFEPAPVIVHSTMNNTQAKTTSKDNSNSSSRNNSNIFEPRPLLHSHYASLNGMLSKGSARESAAADPLGEWWGLRKTHRVKNEAETKKGDNGETGRKDSVNDDSVRSGGGHEK